MNYKGLKMLCYRNIYKEQNYMSQNIPYTRKGDIGKSR